MNRLRSSKFWQERSTREKNLLVAGGSVVLLASVFMVFIEPALDGRAHWQQALPALRSELAEMRSLQKRLGSDLSLANSQSRTPDRASLERSLKQAGITPDLLEASNGLIRLRGTDVAFSALTPWLLKVQQDQSVSVIEADIKARERPDRIDVTLLLRSSGAAP